MRIVSTTTSIAIGFACIMTSAVLGAQMVGLLPDRDATIADEHLHLAQVVAAQCSAAADQNDAAAIRSSLAILLANNTEVISAGIRSPDGKLVMEAGPHRHTWSTHATSDPHQPLQIEVPVLQNNEKWATIELAFVPLPGAGVFGNPLLRLTLFMSASGFIGSLFFLRKALRHLDPSSVIPDRVRAMLDALAEGVIVMDKSEQIVMANEAFCQITGLTHAQTQGRRVSQLTALVGKDAAACGWLTALRSGEPVRRLTMQISPSADVHRTLVLNAVPVLGTDGSRRGLLVTFDDVTSIESANAELARSRDEIARQNKELETLASRDPLTGCLNRRAFMRLFEEAWGQAAEGGAIACIMLDIDHFKSINDRYGHSVGDQVLRQMGQVLQRSVRTEDRVCRYGGEEFCILLPATSFDGSHDVATRIREAILAEVWPVTAVTASIGVSGKEAGAPDVRQLLDQSDKALYAAKRNGRNRVIPWGDPSIDAAPQQTEERRGVAPPAPAAPSTGNARLATLAQEDAQAAIDGISATLDAIAAAATPSAPDPTLHPPAAPTTTA